MGFEDKYMGEPSVSPSGDTKGMMPDADEVAFWVKTPEGELVPGTAEDMERLISGAFDNGYEECRRDAAAGRLSKAGIYCKEDVEGFVAAAEVTALQKFKTALKGFVGVFRFPTEINEFFIKLEEWGIVGEEVNNG
jgi:hypothetical protein